MLVSHYEGTVYYPSTRSSSTQLYRFDDFHAKEARVPFHEHGLPMEAAKRLMEKWNARASRHTSVRYSYCIPTETMIAYYRTLNHERQTTHS